MPNSCPSEERFPLLLLFLEDGQRSSKNNRRILIDKSRYKGITSGASAVLTQWPGHLTTCWLTATLIGLTIILLSMMMFALSVHPGIHLLTARCRSNHLYNKLNDTATIHLVHGPHPWVQSQLDTVEQIAQNYPQSKVELIIIQKETDLIWKMQNMNVVLYSTDPKNDHKMTTKSGDIGGSTYTNVEMVTATESHSPTVGTGKSSTLKNLKRIKRIKRFLKYKNVTSINRIYFYPWNKYQLHINIGTKKLLKMLLHPKNVKQTFKKRHFRNKFENKTTTEMPRITNVQQLIQIYPKIQIKNSTYEEIFKNSPLYFHWQSMNELTRLFAIRVLQMWDFAGITFDLPEFPESSDGTSQSNNGDIYKYIVANNSDAPLASENFQKFKKLVTVGLSSFETLPQGLVTVDDEGLHMETKTTCHAFFGEVLMNLRDAKRETTPADIIRRTLKMFCKRGAVDIDYCQKVNT